MHPPIDFGALFELSPNPYMVLDRSLRYVAANRAYLEVTASRREDLLGRHLFDAFPNDPADPGNAPARLLRASLERVLATGEPDVLALIPYRVPRHTPSGVVEEERFWSATHTPLRGPDGQVAFVLQHTVDVTDVQRLRATVAALEPGAAGAPSPLGLEAGLLGRAHAVQEANRVLDGQRRGLLALFAQAPGFVGYLAGPEHVFEIANPAYAQLVGHRDVVGLSVRAALPEIAGQGFYELLDRVFASGEPYVGQGVRVQLQRQPGAPLEDRYVDFVYQPIRGADGAVAGILVQGQDITEQRVAQLAAEEAQAALRTSEARLRRVVEASGTGAWELDLETGELRADARVVELLGLPRGRRVVLDDALAAMHPEDRARVAESIRAALGGVGGGRYQSEYRVVTPAGTRWVEGRGQVYFGPDGRATSFYGTSGEVTERKRTEAEREQLLARERAARREAEEANRLKDDFLATVSHELRTPLSSILGWAQLLRSRALPEEKRARALDTIERNARAQTALIEDLLDVSRVLAGTLRLDVARVALVDAVEAALETVRPAAEAKGVALQARLEPGLAVAGDAQRLQQVAWNLLSNAVKFTPRGGRVEVEVAADGDAALLRVRDTGQGITPGFLPHVFERFRQEDGSSRRSHGGLGLGLSIVRHLVELHGGSVHVESGGEGQGALFTVRLPRAAARGGVEAEGGAALAREAGLEVDGVLPRWQVPPQLAGVHVLVVDDAADMRELLRTVLEGCRARVTAAASAAEALRALREARPQLLVSDLGLPGEDGYALIQQVRRLPPAEGGRIPAVALTAYARAEDRTRALLAGFQNHVPKPVEPLELVTALARLTDALGVGPA